MQERTVQTLGLAQSDELARIVRAQLTPTSPTALQRGALDELEKRASPERERDRLMGRLAALEGREARSGPFVPVGEIAAAIGVGADGETIYDLSAGDQCAAIYELLGRYGVTIQ